MSHIFIDQEAEYLRDDLYRRVDKVGAWPTLVAYTRDAEQDNRATFHLWGYDWRTSYAKAFVAELKKIGVING